MQAVDKKPSISDRKGANKNFQSKLHLLINKRNKSNDKVIAVVFVLLCLFFVISMYFGYYYRDQPGVMGGILGSTFLVLFLTIKWLHKLWQVKGIMDILLKIMENISPAKANEIMLYLSRNFFVVNPVKKILILAVNPKDTDRLRIGEEVREIEQALRRSKYRDHFEMKFKLAVRFDDIRRALLDYKPQIVHFIGHADKDGLKVEDQHGNAVPIPTEALSGLFGLFSDCIQCIILSACDSAPQADAINQHIKYVIGMLDKIMDKAAIEFTIGFYDALIAGESVEKAFAFGCNAIRFICPDFPAHLIPVLRIGLKNQDSTEDTATPQKSRDGNHVKSH